MSGKVDRSGNCPKCGTWRRVLTRDHIIPKSKGGSNDHSNIQMICANCHQDKTELEVSALHKGTKKSLETLTKMRAWQVGIPKPQSTKDKIRVSLTGRKASPEVRAKMSASQKGRKFTDDHRKAISIALKGRHQGDICRNGHAYTDKNTLIRSDGKRHCRACIKAAKKKHMATMNEGQRARWLINKRASYHRHGDENRKKMMERYYARKS